MNENDDCCFFIYLLLGKIIMIINKQILNYNKLNNYNNPD